MYTQCPECSVAFRVSADVLKMAAGQVRCGGCGVAFNALEHLSETKPATPPLKQELPDPDLPELRPDEPAELEADTPPDSISAEQSAALLKTLDQLSGEDIRIEDTGIEWRVIDEEPEPEEPAHGPDEPSQIIDEMLFDDNTVLPDDFDEVVEAPPQPRVEESPSTSPEPEKPQFDLDLSEPDEWDDLLGDLDVQPARPVVDGSEASEAPLDVDTQFEIQAEAMGIDLSGIYESADEEAHADLRLEEEPEPETVTATESESEAEDIAETSIEEDLFAAAFETEAAAKSREDTSSGEAVDFEEILPEELLALEEPEEEEVAQDEQPEDRVEDVDLALDLQAEDGAEIEDDVDVIARGFDNDVERDIETLSMSLDDEEDAVTTSGEEPVIPEMSEEEKTINMMIDQELFNIAVEDEDGFASTIVQLHPDAEHIEDADKDDASDDPGKKKDKKKKKKDKSAKDSAKPGPDVSVETIIMEGDFVRGELDGELQADDVEEQPDAPSPPEITIPINREKDDYARRREMTSAPPGAGTWAGLVALVLLLGLQFIHQSREALATVPAFNSAIGPVYRMLGQPLTPEWNIGGWRFEATKGDTDETGELLTIYSRVGNNSEEPLPYPLVHLSLTDRFEGIIGSAVMEPAEYLPENTDPRKPVSPGNSFNAVISIESPSPDATGFKLNVCYRLASGQLRCADHDFK